MRILLATAFALALNVQTPSARADSAPQLFRLTGAAPDAGDPVPKTFVIDALIKPGDSEAQSSIEGWFAASQEPAASGEVTGTCVERKCALTAELDENKLTFTADFGGASPFAAHVSVKTDRDKTARQAAATLTPLKGPIEGLGALADPDAVQAAELDELLMWARQTARNGFVSGQDEPPDGFQRGSLATWQQAKGRLATGLIFVSDLTELRADAAAARKAAGWTALGEPAHGWSGAYPAALLPKAGAAAGEQRFASADGKAVLAVAIDPPMSSADFDAYTDKLTGEDGRKDAESTRVNGDMDMRYEKAGLVTVGAYRNRDGGMLRMVFTYPADRAEALAVFEPLLQRSLKADSDLKP